LRLQRRADEMGVKLTIATVDGDDLRPRLDELRKRGVKEMFNGAPLPDKVLTANAYFGGFPDRRCARPRRRRGV